MNNLIFILIFVWFEIPVMSIKRINFSSATWEKGAPLKEAVPSECLVVMYLGWKLSRTLNSDQCM